MGSSYANDNLDTPVYWAPGTEAASALPTLGGVEGGANDANNLGQTVGCADPTDPQVQAQAVLWLPPVTPPSSTTTNPSTSTTAANAAVVTPAFTG